MRNTILFISLIWLASCSTTRYQSSMTMNFNNSNIVKIDSVSADCLLSMRSMAIVDDTLIIANEKNKFLFETYELPSLRHIASGGRNGQGPGELVNPNLFSVTPYFGHCIALKGRSSGLPIGIVDIESLQKVDRMFPELPEGWTFTQHFFFLKPDLIAAERGLSPHTWAIFNLDGKIIHEFPLNIPDEIKAQGVDDFTKMAYDMSWGAASADNRTMVIGYRAFPVVEYYDFGGEMKARLESPYSAGDKLRCWLVKMQSTKDHVYLAYNNFTPKSKSVSTIVKTDWDGNVEATYTLNRTVPVFVPDEKNNRIYFCTSSESEVDYIYFFDM